MKRPKKLPKSRTSIDLFCGAGGLTLGLKQAGFACLFANDHDVDAEKTFRHNHPEATFARGSIANLEPADVRRELKLQKGELDLLAGGPPCQGFSTVGNKDKFDPRNKLFAHYVRFLEEFEPKFTLFENVPGFKRLYGGEAFEALSAELRRLGYAVFADIFNAVNYGLPQSRQRFLVVGRREGLRFAPPPITHSTESDDLFLKSALTFGQAVGDLPDVGAGETANAYKCPPQNEYQARMRGREEVLTEHVGPNHGRDLIEVIKRVPPGGCIKDIPERHRPRSGYGNTYARLWWDKPSTTITRNLGCPSSSRCIHPYLHRGLTLREGARLQGFPDSYRFHGSASSKNLQVGNSVPPLLAMVIGKSIIKALDGSEGGGKSG